MSPIIVISVRGPGRRVPVRGPAAERQAERPGAVGTHSVPVV
ncbi:MULTISPECIES: hypothetical protein [unclassified Methylobacterium]|nr:MULTISPECIES: hypothetical protein [unclassified Methylobacterium]